MKKVTTIELFEKGVSLGCVTFKTKKEAKKYGEDFCLTIKTTN